jgi:hypothetical protein
MPYIPGEHNCLEHDTAARVASELKALYTDGSVPQEPITTDKAIGSPQLVKTLDEAPRHDITPRTDAIMIYAVDGGSTVVGYGGRAEVIAWRAGMVCFRDRIRLSEQCFPPEMVACDRSASADIVGEYASDIPGGYNPAISARAVDDLRWLAEWRLVESLIEDAEPGCLILIDGSLRGHPAFDLENQRRIMRLAAERQVHVAAVTKQSSLSVNDSFPLDSRSGDSPSANSDSGLWYRRLNRNLPETSGWLGDIYLARLHPDAEKPYRVDINRYDSDIDDVFAMLVSVSDDIEFAGYPYPLAAAHRLARIDGILRNHICETLEQFLERIDFPRELWHYLTGDVHDRLNADIPRENAS